MNIKENCKILKLSYIFKNMKKKLKKQNRLKKI